jgi:hypothetical protein
MPVQLLDYLELRSQTVSDFAAEIGMRVDTVWRHAHGKRRPDAKTVRLYEEYTKGAVTANDWVDLELAQASPPEDDDSPEPVAATG